MRVLVWLAAILLCLAAPAAGTISKPVHFERDFAYLPGFGTERLELFSGQMAAALDGQEAAFAFSGAQGLRLDGLDRVCWGEFQQHCAEGVGALSIRVEEGGGAAFRMEGDAHATIDAAHALAMARDMSQEQAPAGLELPRHAMVATLVDARIDLAELPAVARSGLVPDAQRMGSIVPLQDTRIEIHQATGVVGRVEGGGQLVVFEGQARSPVFTAEAAVFPFAPGATASMARATTQAAQVGLDLQRLADAMAGFAGARSEPGGTQAIDSMVKGVLNGAILGIQAGPESSDGGSGLDDALLVRFERLDVAAGAQSVHAAGPAPLVLEGGEVQGAQPLIGFAWVAFPWWSYMLWAVGLGLWVLAVATRAPKRNEQMDGKAWVGRLLGWAALVLAFWLWDREVEGVLGFSALGASDTSLSTGLLVAVEFGLFSLIMFAAAAPLRLILRNMARLAGKGTFMGLANPAATLLGFLMGAPLLLAYLEWMLQRVLEG